MAAVRSVFSNMKARQGFTGWAGKLLIPAFWIVMVAFSACGEQQPEPKKAGGLSQEDPRRQGRIAWRDLSYIDTIKVGDTVRHDFVFYNTGWKPVQVKHAIPNRDECSCQVPARQVPIGEQDTVKMTCVFPRVEERAGVNIVIEHDTPQDQMLLIYIAKVE
jgi:hypothetical protein